MKKQICMICILLAAALLCPMTAFAAEADGDDIYAVATTESGRQITLADAPDAGEMGDLESYDLMIGDEPVLTVGQSDVPDITSGADNNGYFSAEFDLPDTTKQVFLAGLSAEKVEEIQNRIIASYVAGENFNLEDLSFIDAEKMRPQNDGDDSLCWAAATSNMLTYTGWAAQAGFASTDDVFEDFIASFTDHGGNPIYGVGWFINGVNSFALLLPGQAAAATAGTGGYLPDYAYDQLVRDGDIETSGADGMKDLCRTLTEGCGVGLDLSVYYRGSYNGGHSVTCWGFIVDTAYREDEPDHYAGIFFTDSDNSQPTSGDRRNAKNMLHFASLTTGTDANGALTFEFDLDSNNHAVMLSFIGLLPYDSSVEKETSQDATRDKVNTPDLWISGFGLDTDLSDASGTKLAEKIESNTAFYYTPYINNRSDKQFSGRTAISIVITDDGGEEVFSRRLNPNLSIPMESGVSYGKSQVYDAGLPDGDYTVTTTLNGDHAVPEAYYYNNQRSFAFKVRDSYLLGDTDGSGSIDVTDATKIQRIIADYDEGADDRMMQRAEIIGGELSVLEATLIQRYIADYSVNFPIGEKRLYD